MSKLKIQILDGRLSQSDMLPKTADSAGIDLHACIESDILLYPMESVKIGSGVKMAIPKHFAGIIAPRSSVGVSGVWLSNVVGIIDSDYRGEIIMHLKNVNDDPVKITPLQRVAQITIVSHFPYRDNTQFCDVLDETERGEGGFGSTGKTKD